MSPARRLVPLALVLALAGCDAISDALSVDAIGTLTLAYAPAPAPADGATKVTVTARVPVAMVRNQLKAQFRSAVSGASQEVLFGADGTAPFVLTAPRQVGSDVVSVVVIETVSLPTGGTEQRQVAAGSLTVEHARAFPTRIDVDPGAFTLSASNFSETVVTAHLRREVGTASDGTTVEFTARDSAGRPIGSFRDVTPSLDGRATARFSVGDTSYRGAVVIRARVVDAAGNAVEGQATIAITD